MAGYKRPLMRSLMSNDERAARNFRVPVRFVENGQVSLGIDSRKSKNWLERKAAIARRIEKNTYLVQARKRLRLIREGKLQMPSFAVVDKESKIIREPSFIERIVLFLKKILTLNWGATMVK